MARRPGCSAPGGALCAVAFLALLAVAYGWTDARSLDARALQGFVELRSARRREQVSWVAASGDPLQVGLMAALLTGVAVVRGRPRVGLFVIALLGADQRVEPGAQGGCWPIRATTARSTALYISPAAFPSGHATAAMAIAIALVVVVPPASPPACRGGGHGVGAGRLLLRGRSRLALPQRRRRWLPAGHRSGRWLSRLRSRRPRSATPSARGAPADRLAPSAAEAYTAAAALAAMVVGVLAAGRRGVARRALRPTSWPSPASTRLLAVVVAIAVAAAAVVGGVTVALPST